jgi:hypothetical protein
MLGPVGMRCRDCGKPAYDPLTSLTPTQFLVGLAIAIAGGAIAAFVASRIGFFSIFVSFFAGGLIAETVVRSTGYKRGPKMLAMVFGGILVGGAIGFGLNVFLMMGDLNAIAAEVAAEVGEESAGPLSLGPVLVDMVTWALISAGAACAGAWSRLR